MRSTILVFGVVTYSLFVPTHAFSQNIDDQKHINIADTAQSTSPESATDDIPSITEIVKQLKHADRAEDPKSLREARRKLMRHAWDTYLSDLASTLEPEDQAAVEELIHAGASHLDRLQRWKLKTSYLDYMNRHSHNMQDMSIDTFKQMRRIMHQLVVDSKELRDIEIQWLTAGDRWKQLELSQLHSIISPQWIITRSPEQSTLKKTIHEHLRTQYFTNTAYLDQPGNKSDMFDIMRIFLAVQPRSERIANARWIQQQYLTPERITQWSFDEINALHTTLFTLMSGTNATFTSPLEPWIEHGNHWKDISHNERLQLIGLLKVIIPHSDTRKENNAYVTVKNYVWNEYIADVSLSNEDHAQIAADYLLAYGNEYDARKRQTLLDDFNRYYSLQTITSLNTITEIAGILNLLRTIESDDLTANVELKRNLIMQAVALSSNVEQQHITAQSGHYVHINAAMDESFIRTLSFEQLLKCRQLKRHILAKGEHPADMDISWLQLTDDWKNLELEQFHQLLYPHWLRTHNDVQKELKQSIAHHLHTQYIFNDTYFATAPDRALLFRVIEIIVSDLQKEDKVAYYGKIKDWYLDADRLKRLDFQQLEALQRCLLITAGAGTHTPRVSVCEPWITLTDNWKSLNINQLLSLAYLLQYDSAAANYKDTRAYHMLKDYVWHIYLAETADVADSNRFDVIALTNCFGADLMQEQKADLLKRLTSQYLNDEHVTDLTLGRIQSIAHAIAALSGNYVDADRLVAQWVMKNDAWQKWTPPTIALFMSVQFKEAQSTEVQEARSRILTYLSQPERWADAEISLQVRLIQTLRRMDKDDTPNPASELISRITTHLVNTHTPPEGVLNDKTIIASYKHISMQFTPEFIASLNFTQLISCHSICRAGGMDHASVRDMDMHWLNTSDQWKTLPPRQLVALLMPHWETTNSTEQEEWKRLLAEHARVTFVENQSFIQSTEDKSALFELLPFLFMPKEEHQRIAAAVKIRNLYASPSILSALSFEDMQSLRSSLHQFKVQPQEADVSPISLQWVKHNTSWKSFDTTEMSGLNALLKADIPDDMRSHNPEYTGVMDHVWTTYFAQNASYEQTDKQTFTNLILTFGPDLPQKRRSELADRYTQEYTASNYLLKDYDLRELESIANAISILTKDSNDTDRVYARWVALNESWKALRISEQAQFVADNFTKAQLPQVQQAQLRIVNHIDSNLRRSEYSLSQLIDLLYTLQNVATAPDHNPAGELRQKLAVEAFSRLGLVHGSAILPNEEQFLMLDSELPDRDRQKLMELVMQLAQTFGAYPEDVRINRPVEYIKQLEALMLLMNVDINQIDAYELYGKAVWMINEQFPMRMTVGNSDHVFSGYQRWLYRYLGMGSRMPPRSASYVRKKVADSKTIHPAAVMALSGHYRNKGSQEIAAWKAFLEEKIADPQLTADERARWMMGRAFAGELDREPTVPLGGREWLDQAYAEAESEDIRRDCVRWLIQGTLARGKVNEARSLLDSFTQQFDSDEFKVLVDDLQSQITATEKRRGRLAATVTDTQQDSWRRTLEQRLEKAREKQDTEAVNRIERILNNL